MSSGQGSILNPGDAVSNGYVSRKEVFDHQWIEKSVLGEVFLLHRLSNAARHLSSPHTSEK